MNQKQKINYPEKICLAWTPTPLEKMKRLSKKMGVEIYFKRDDYTGSELSGNKIRKLEFILSDALKKGADTVITCGGAQSNHCRATALAAARVGLKSVLLLRTPDPDHPPATEANILLNALAGSTLVWITPDQYNEREIYFKQEAEKLKSNGALPYIIPEGGSTALGAWGYVSAIEELANDLAMMDGDSPISTTVISATGSGGTTAGLALGNQLLDLGFRVAGVNVCNDKDYFLDVINGIITDFEKTFIPEKKVAQASNIEIIDGYVGRGYALSSPKELEAIIDLARLEGVVLDPVYTGKAYFAMVSELEKNPNCFGPRIVFFHTGGLFGLFPVANQMTSLI
jgi:D-cysteine desulfhydrase